MWDEQEHFARVVSKIFTWLLAAMGWPAVAGDVLAYGTVIATGNAVVEWVP